jgi:hypothetical protein
MAAVGRWESDKFETKDILRRAIKTKTKRDSCNTYISSDPSLFVLHDRYVQRDLQQSASIGPAMYVFANAECHTVKCILIFEEISLSSPNCNSGISILTQPHEREP